MMLWSLIAVLTSCSENNKIKPERKTIQQAVFASGQVIRENEYVVSANCDGIITELPVKEGDDIGAGKLLFVIKNDVQTAQTREAELVYKDASRNALPSAPPLQQVQIQIRQTEIQLDQDKQNYERYYALLRQNSASQLEFEKAELQYKTTRNNLRSLTKNYQEARNALLLNAEKSLSQLNAQQSVLADYQIKADKGGTITNLYKKEGELVRKGEVIARISSGTPQLEMYIAEEDITKISLGQSVLVHLNTYPDTVFKARVTEILPAFDTEQQSCVIKGVFQTSPPVLLSGVQLQANIELGNRSGVLMIPTEAVVRGNYVMLQDGGEKKIVLGQKYGKWVEVRSGLTEEDLILLPAKSPRK